MNYYSGIEKAVDRGTGQRALLRPRPITYLFIQRESSFQADLQRTCCTAYSLLQAPFDALKLFTELAIDVLVVSIPSYLSMFKSSY